MSLATITQASNDPVLRDRIHASVNKEAAANPDLGSSVFGQYVLDQPWVAWQALIWPVAIDTEADYEFAVNNGHPSPGSDDVIDDAKIQAAVTVHWPAEVPPWLPPVTPI